MSDRDIDATNVLPAFEASIAHGVSEAELAGTIGWRRSELEAEGAVVSAESTYAHMELMFSKGGYAPFVLAATARHTASSLGVLGLACKTAATVGEALACHARFQHLTNRTASYASSVDQGRLTLEEHRYGLPRLGSFLISDYTLLIALQLLRDLAAEPPRVIHVRSRRGEMGQTERSRLAAFVGAEIELGSPRAALVVDASLLDSAVVGADGELARYLRGVLERSSPAPTDEPEIVRQVRAALQLRLVRGAATLPEVAKALGIGARTLQRRLADHDVGFSGVLESTRRRLAEGYLADPERSLAEIAYLLGYDEHASFHRAFRRWHGTTPKVYRDGLRAT